MASADPLLRPYQLKGPTLKNRVVGTPHAPTHADDGTPGEPYQRYHEEKSRADRARRQPAARDGYRLYRIGDAVASRNIHAAILDALKLCKIFWIIAARSSETGASSSSKAVKSPTEKGPT